MVHKGLTGNLLVVEGAGIEVGMGIMEGEGFVEGAGREQCKGIEVGSRWLHA